MRETVLSNCEKAFVDAAIIDNLRIDKRELNEFRDIGLFFGENFGSVLCSLGETRVFAQVSCEVSTPKASRPNEGTLFINVEMGPTHSDASIQINRILERTLRESRCVDLESLCIIAEEKVWNLRVDISILNHEGNVMDCACIAAVSALAHFKRPDVTTSGDGEFIIHTPAEKDLIPIVLHHYPICVSYALFGEGKIPVADPTVLEERVSDASLVLAINAYKELCCMHLTGFSLTSPRLILQCSEIAADRAKRVVEFIKSTLEDDEKERADESTPRKGLISKLSSSVNTNFRDVQSVGSLSSSQEGDENMQEDSAEEEVTCGPANLIDSKTVASKKWSEENESESSGESESDQEMKPEAVKPEKRQQKQQKNMEDQDDSEEEETIVL